MSVSDVAVDEDATSGAVNVCVEIGALPGDGLQTELTVTLSTTDGSKACNVIDDAILTKHEL